MSVPELDDRLARLALSQLGEPGELKMAGLVADLGAPRVHAELAARRDLGDVLSDVAGRLAVLEPDRDLELAMRQGFRWLVPGDEEWPRQVDDLEHAEPLVGLGGRSPLGLWVRGPVRLDQLAGSVAIVGSRSATTYGEDVASSIAGDVARAGLVVVSGGAFGIDLAAHRGALTGGGQTVAVLACGLDRPYPVAHKPLFDHLAAEGAVVSELSPGRAPMRNRFLTRNRVIAALTAGTVVVEAAARSGALNTATWAARLQRPLMGVPGPVTSAPSQGVHALIRSGAATLVTSGDDVLELVGRPGEHLAVEIRGPERPRDRLPPRQRQVLEAVPHSRAAGVESIARTAGLGRLDVGACLEALVAAGLVEHEATGWRLADGAARTG